MLAIKFLENRLQQPAMAWNPGASPFHNFIYLGKDIDRKADVDGRLGLAGNFCLGV